MPFLILIVLLAAFVTGCTNEAPRPTVDTTPALAPPPPPAPPEFGGGAPAYRVVEITGGGGGIRGEVRVDGAFPLDTMVRPTVDVDACGAAFLDSTIRRSGDRLANTVVWLVDARSGKALPLDGRFEVAHRRCRMTPRVQAVRVGGTLNVRSSDRTVHHARFVRGADGSTIKIVTEHDAGQVVPDETVLRGAGRIEVRCDAHPWTRAWILAFDHPYYAITDRRGSFAIDSVPPGRYRLLAWHERFGTVDDSVTVVAGEAAQVTVTLRR